MNELDLLHERLDQLLKRFTSVKVDNERLGNIVRQQSQQINKQKGQIARLEEALHAVQVASSVSSEQDKENLKKHLEKVIRVIEKNIEML